MERMEGYLDVCHNTDSEPQTKYVYVCVLPLLKIDNVYIFILTEKYTSSKPDCQCPQ